MTQRVQVIIPENDVSGRLDKVLAELLARQEHSLSRTRVKSLLDQGAISLETSDGARTIGDPSHKVKPGEVYTIDIPPVAPAVPVAQSIPLDVVFEDEDVIVVNKPAGLVVHPAAGNPDNTLVNALLAHCGDSLSGIGGEARPGIVHRLDKDTSGLMVVAKTDQAHHSLSEQFASHGRDGRLERAYKALAWGVPRQPSFTIEGNIGRSSSNRKKMAVVGSGGKPAITHVSIDKIYLELISLVSCILETGRTHQIRVHLAHTGYPLVGDPFYGGTKKGIVRRTKGEHADVMKTLRAFPRQALHAYLLGFEHPKSGRKLRFESGLPQDFEELMHLLNGDG